MISNQWYIILESREIRKNQVKGLIRFGEKLVAWRDGMGKLSVFADKCPHRGIQLSLGKIKDQHLQCPFHGFEYDETGKCCLIPANGKASPVPDHIRAKTYRVAEANGFVYLWYSNAEDAPAVTDKTLPWFDNLDDRMVHNTFTALWNAHYTRVIENQLDVVHVPFIHHTTIGRGIGPVVNGPFTETTENSISFWPFNEQDHGQLPLKPAQIKEPPSKSTYIRFIFPNLWQNHIMDSMRIIVAFVPVDEGHTLMYLRTYQKLVTLPLLRDLYFLFSNMFNRIVLRQDQRVVETHQPMPVKLRMEENLIPGDHPIILYRKKRQEIQDNASNAFNANNAFNEVK
jgi:phenylpropionate dioxygenase-like ring-hydroxylating dioxygenase large terminal subunit